MTTTAATSPRSSKRARRPSAALSLFEAEQRSRARLRTVLDFSEQLAVLDDPEAVLEATARFAATRLGTYAATYAAEPDGTLRRAALVHSDAALPTSARGARGA